MQFRLVGSDLRRQAFCLDMTGSELFLVADQPVAQGLALEIWFGPEAISGISNIAAFAEVIDCKTVSMHTYELAVSIKGIKSH